VTHGIQDAPDVDVEDAAVFGFGGLIQRAFPFNASTVKGNVETAKLADREIDHRFDISIFRDIRTDERRIAAEFLNFIDNLRTFFLAAAGQNDLCTSAREFGRRSLADTGSSSGYERNFA
jgi:hypothetical protein